MNGQREKERESGVFLTEQHRKQEYKRKKEKFKLYKCRARLLVKK